MPIVFDDVSGSVDPETPPAQEEPQADRSATEPDFNKMPAVLIQALWRRAEQRLERLYAD